MKHIVILTALLQASAILHANPTADANGRLTSREGRTLYTFDKDSAGQSSCAGGCLAAWPAFTVVDPKLAGRDFSIVVRGDGVQQWAFQGKPLYFFAGDAQPGEANGDNHGGVWHVIRKSASVKPAYNEYDSPRSVSYGY